MVTREQIEEIQAESREKGVSVKSVLKEKGIPEGQYFRWRRRYASGDIPGGFLPLTDGGLPSGITAAGCSAASPVAGRKPEACGGESWMTIELRTGGGTDVRIQGGLAPAMVQAILKSI